MLRESNFSQRLLQPAATAQPVIRLRLTQGRDNGLIISLFPVHVALYLVSLSLSHNVHTLIQFLPRDALVHSALLRLHVCLSVTLVDQDHIDWKSWKLLRSS